MPKPQTYRSNVFQVEGAGEFPIDRVMRLAKRRGYEFNAENLFVCTKGVLFR